MKDFIFNNSYFSLLIPIFQEILRLIIFIPLIVLLIRWVKVSNTKKEKSKPFALLTSTNGNMRHEIIGYETAIGRMKSSDIVLNYPFISRNHACIVYRNKEWLLFDTASSTGVTLNGKKLRKPANLKNGDIIGFSGLEFVFSPAPDKDEDREIYSYKNIKSRHEQRKAKKK